jgi:hypothetical protein
MYSQEEVDTGSVMLDETPIQQDAISEQPIEPPAEPDPFA